MSKEWPEIQQEYNRLLKQEQQQPKRNRRLPTAPSKPVISEYKPIVPKGGAIMLPYLIGRTVNDAALLLATIGWLIRVVRENGAVVECDDDDQFGRVSVSVYMGKIIGIEGVEPAPESEEIAMPSKG